MVSDIPKRLIRLFRDFPETIALKEMQFQSLSLFFGEFLAQPIQKISGRYFIDKKGLACSANLLFIEGLSVIVLPPGQILSAVYCPVVGDLNDPGGRRPFARVKELCFLKEQKENILAQVFRFRRVPQNSLCDA